MKFMKFHQFFKGSGITTKQNYNSLHLKGEIMLEMIYEETILI